MNLNEQGDSAKVGILSTKMVLAVTFLVLAEERRVTQVSTMLIGVTKHTIDWNFSIIAYHHHKLLTPA